MSPGRMAQSLRIAQCPSKLDRDHREGNRDPSTLTSGSAVGNWGSKP